MARLVLIVTLILAFVAATQEAVAAEESSPETLTPEVSLTNVDPTTEDQAEGWTLVYQDDFNGSQLAPQWHVVDGEWRIEDGRLVGQGQILFDLSLPEAQRLTFNASSDRPGDLSAMLGVDRRGLESGYFLGFGSDGNQRSKLLVQKQETTQSPHTATPGKTHRIDAQREGHDITLRVDGQIVLQQKLELPLAGDAHPYVGLYMHRVGRVDDVRVYTRPDSISAAAQAVLDAAPAMDDRPMSNNLLPNGSFERWRTGIRNMPADWSVRLFDRADDARLVDDIQQVHRGGRAMRLRSTSGKGVTLDAIPKEGIELVPGQAYDITCWARATAGRPTLIIEPGGFSAELSADWRPYHLTFTMPRDAQPRMGFFLRVNGGEALIDDVSMVPAGQSVRWPDHVMADRTGLDILSVESSWHRSDSDPEWTARVPVVLTELMGERANNVVVKIKLSDALTDVWHSRIGERSLKVVDAESGRRLPHVLVDADRYAGPTGEDELVFRVNVPARSRKTVFVYYDTDRVDVPKLQTELPLRMAKPSRYKHSLEVRIDSSEPVIRIEPDDRGATVTAFDEEPTTAVAVSPDGQREVSLEVTAEDRPHVWRLDGIPDDEPGVWRVDVETAEGTIATQAIVRDRAMWAVDNATPTVAGDVPPIHDADWARIAAARGEREAFQVGLKSETDLTGVTLHADEFIHADGDATISADRVHLAFVERIHVTMPWPLGRPAGWYHDPLVPWSQRDVAAGRAELAWVTVDIPADAEAGLYWGQITARDDQGDEVALPVQLEVFDFSLSEENRLALILGGDIWERVRLGHRVPEGELNPYYALHTAEAALALAQLLAEHGASPFYYHHDKSPYAVPWHYDPATGSATFDFSHLDTNLGKMVDQWNQRYLFFGGKFAAGWRRPGRVYDWSRDLDRAWQAWWEEAVPEHTHSRSTPEGQRMLRAYAQGIAEHLEERGWLDHAYLYITDEDKSDEVRRVALESAETVKSTTPALNTFVFSNAEHRYPDYLEHIDVFAGLMTEEHATRYQAGGGEWWGAYNSGGMPTMPLTMTRALGARAWYDGASGYSNWAIWRKPDMLVDTNHYTYLPANAGYPMGTFVTDARYDFSGWGTWVYPWPSWEPVDSSASQTLFVGSIRLAALAEGADDYLYLQMAESLADRQTPDAQGGLPAETQLQAMHKLMDTAHTRVMKFDYFDIDPRQYQELRLAIGRMLNDDLRVSGSNETGND